MILTVTMNPSIDISYPLDGFALDGVNRAAEVSKTAGGKGLNVTRVLAELGERVAAAGLIGGSNGDFLLQHLDSQVERAFYQIAGDTRNCIAILHDGQQTEILEAGPTVSEEEATGFLQHFERCLSAADVVTISGSLPAGLPADYYVSLLAAAEQAGKPVVLDCSGQSLEAVLRSEHKPTVIKPNSEELSQLLGRPVSGEPAELKAVLSEPLFAGIDWIVVSLGAQGAFAKHGSQFYRVDIPRIQVVNPVGSGDSTVAGIASALSRREDDHALLRRANALGMLNAQEKMTGHVNMANYQDIYEKIEVSEV